MSTDTREGIAPNLPLSSYLRTRTTGGRLLHLLPFCIRSIDQGGLGSSEGRRGQVAQRLVRFQAPHRLRDRFLGRGKPPSSDEAGEETVLFGWQGYRRSSKSNHRTLPSEREVVKNPSPFQINARANGAGPKVFAHPGSKQLPMWSGKLARPTEAMTPSPSWITAVGNPFSQHSIFLPPSFCRLPSPLQHRLRPVRRIETVPIPGIRHRWRTVPASGRTVSNFSAVSMQWKKLSEPQRHDEHREKQGLASAGGNSPISERISASQCFVFSVFIVSLWFTNLARLNSYGSERV